MSIYNLNKNVVNIYVKGRQRYWFNIFIRLNSKKVKPWLKTGSKDLTKVLNKKLEEKFNVSNLNGGFLGYDKSFVIELNNNNNLKDVKKEVVKFLTTLEDKTLYSLLPVCSYFNDNNSLVYKSIFKEKVVITKDTLVSSISDPLYLAIDYNLYKYGMESIDQVVLFYKIWVKEEDLKVAYNDADIRSEYLSNKYFPFYCSDRMLWRNKLVNSSDINTNH
jgi:hypothetical protein